MHMFLVRANMVRIRRGQVLGICPARGPSLTAVIDEARLTGSARQDRSVVVHEGIVAVLAVRATTGLATSALPGAPVQPVRQRRQRPLPRRLLGMLSGRGR